MNISSNLETFAKINLYKILKVSKDADKKKIKKKYNKLILKYHPDKENGDPELFEKITIAYKILSNEALRKKYDILYKKYKINKREYIDLKKSFKNFKLSEKDKPIKNNFKNEFENLNLKHGVKNNKDVPINKNDFKKRLKDLVSKRNNIEIEDIINDDEIDSSKFNKLFENKIQKKSKNQITKYEVQCANAITNYNNLNYSDLYASDGFNSKNYSSLEEAFDINYIPYDTNESYANKKKLSKNSIKEIIKKYNEDTEKLKNHI